MRSVRMLLGVMTLALVGGCAQANASQRNAVWVEVSPGTVQTGAIVAIRAACTNNSSPATVNSTAFGTVTVKPKATYLSAEVNGAAERVSPDATT